MKEIIKIKMLKKGNKYIIQETNTNVGYLKSLIKINILLGILINKNGVGTNG